MHYFEQKNSKIFSPEGFRENAWGPYKNVFPGPTIAFDGLDPFLSFFVFRSRGRASRRALYVTVSCLSGVWDGAPPEIKFGASYNITSAGLNNSLKANHVCMVCMYVCMYGMEVCPLRKSDLKGLDFVVDRFFMKLFQTNNIKVIRHAQCMFNFMLPSVLIEKRCYKFRLVS